MSKYEYKNIDFNPKLSAISVILEDAGDWEFIGCYEINEWLWVAKFRRELDLHRQQLVKEIREAVEGIHKNGRSFSTADQDEPPLLSLDDILALPELQEEK